MTRLNDKNLVNIFFTRWAMAAALVFATYNPTPVSLVSVLSDQMGTSDIFSAWPLKIIILLAFGIGWWVFLKTAYHSLRGMAIAIGFIMLLSTYVAVTQFNEWGYRVGNEALIWVALLIVSFLLGVGATASHIKLRWAGVRNVDDVSDDN